MPARAAPAPAQLLMQRTDGIGYFYGSVLVHHARWGDCETLCPARSAATLAPPSLSSTKPMATKSRTQLQGPWLQVELDRIAFGDLNKWPSLQRHAARFSEACAGFAVMAAALAAPAIGAHCSGKMARCAITLKPLAPGSVRTL